MPLDQLLARYGIVTGSDAADAAQDSPPAPAAAATAGVAHVCPFGSQQHQDNQQQTLDIIIVRCCCQKRQGPCTDKLQVQPAKSYPLLDWPDPRRPNQPWARCSVFKLAPASRG